LNFQDAAATTICLFDARTEPAQSIVRRNKIVQKISIRETAIGYLAAKFLK
jgi:hypothetical protein